MTRHTASRYRPGPVPAFGLATPPCWVEARQRCDDCWQRAPIPLCSLSECVSERVGECQHFCDGTGECKSVCELEKKEYMIWFWVILFNYKKQFTNMCRAIVTSCLSAWRVRWWVSQKVEDCVLSWRSGWKWCLWDTCWHLRDLSCENKAMLTEDQVKSIVFTSESRTCFSQSALQWPEATGVDKNKS